MKTCSKCNETKPDTEFSKNSKGRDALRSYCRACAKIAKSEWDKANPDKRKASHAAWNAANPGKKKAITAKWNAYNPEKRKALKAKWDSDNPLAKRIHDQNREARKRENGGKLSKGLAERLFKLQRGKCACCGEPLGTDYHLDHIMPLALGGSNTDNNIQLLRSVCNLNKRSKHPIDFMQQRGFLL